MIPDENLFLLFKFGEKRWIDKILKGELSFSCAGAFINQAKKAGNTIQGDIHEGIFARLKRGDIRIDQMKERLMSDLEILDEGEYLCLRRRSAKLKPIFCFYGYKAGGILKAGGDNLSVGINRIRYEFDPQLYTGFTSDWKISPLLNEPYRFRLLLLRIEVFKEKLENAMKLINKCYRAKNIDYDKMQEKEFFIEPTPNYDELFYKLPQYKE